MKSYNDKQRALGWAIDTLRVVVESESEPEIHQRHLATLREMRQEITSADSVVLPLDVAKWIYAFLDSGIDDWEKVSSGSNIRKLGIAIPQAKEAK